MKILDEAYLYLRWSVNKKLNSKTTTIWALNYLFFPILSAIFVLFLCILTFLISVQINLSILIIIGTLSAFYISEKLIDGYFTKEKQDEIINNSKRPGFIKYVITGIIIIGTLFIIVLVSILIGYFYHKNV